MNIRSLNNKIVIIKDKMKKSLLELINSDGVLLNIKIITLSELKKKYYFDYDNETIYYICSKYNVISDIAKIYLNNMYYIINIDEEKIRFLNCLKDELIDNGLIYENSLFKEYLKDKDIVLFDLDDVDKFYLNIFDELKLFNRVESYNYNNSFSKHELYKANTMEEEISFVCSKICELIKKGININNIKLSNVNGNYLYIIKKLFKMFNIPIELDNFTSIKGTKLVKLFKDNYQSDISKTVDIMFSNIKTKKDNYIYKQIINIVNSYCFIDDYDKVKELIFSDIDRVKSESDKYDNAVRVVDIFNEIISEDDYVFLINYNEGVIPINYKDEEYLNDRVRKLLGISTSCDLNNSENNNVIKSILRVKNLIVTYSKHDLTSELYISSSYNNSLFDEKDIIINYNNSNLYNKVKLVSELDENNKFGVVSSDLITLSNHYNTFKYLDYNNKYNGISSDKLYEYLSNQLSLSYTSLNSYNECSFKYYLDYVLRIGKFKDSFEMTIGNIFHHILSICFLDNFDFESSWNNEINSCKYIFNNGEKYFLDKLKNDLILVIDTIKNQLNYTLLKKSMYEKEIIIDVNSDLHIIFKGYVDKILYDEFNGETIVAIVDYKTGNPNLSINNIVYGLDMQLPIYIYLIKNSISNVRIGGFYIQKILSSDKNIDERIDSLKLQGYSNSNIDVLEKVDSSYMNSNFIKSLKVGNNGFYAYSKVISDEDIDKLYSIVNDKIIETCDNILSAKFDINPKKIKDKLRGCNYCKYKDICYMKNEDIIELDEVKDVFGGEVNG